MELAEAVKQAGFESEDEFHKMVAAVDLSVPGELEQFKK
jgi:hypothetical protein